MAGLHGAGRKAWQEMMAKDGVKVAGRSGGGKRKRSSGRVRQLSRFVKRVDRDTRAQLCAQRLATLEADNYVERGDDDDDGSDEWVSDSEEKKTSRGRGGSKGKGKGRDGGGAKSRPKRSLAQIIASSGITADDGHPNYLSVAAPPSTLPARRLCSVCGFTAAYACTRCGQRYCGRQCNTVHKEERCLKFL